MTSPRRVLILGAGEMASGIAVRLHRARFAVSMTEISEPLAVRRGVAFADAACDGTCRVESIETRRADHVEDEARIREAGAIPLLVTGTIPEAWISHSDVLVDGRMMKGGHGLSRNLAPLVIGIGPGFHAGDDCHYAIETERGHTLGRVIESGPTRPNSGIPGMIAGVSEGRILRATADGRIEESLAIGAIVTRGEEVARTGGKPVFAAIDGILRGVIRPGTRVSKGLKIGDVDPRMDVPIDRVSDKALAIAGGVLEAIMRGPA